MTESLKSILRRFDRQERPVLCHEDVRSWPAGVLDRWLAAGVLQKGDLASSIVYYDCAEHCTIEFDPVEHPQTGKLVSRHRCHHDSCGGLVFVDVERFQLWDLYFEGLAGFVARELGVAGRVVSLVPGRVAMLGTLQSAAGLHDVFLARGLYQCDATELIRGRDRLLASAKPIVLVPEQMPPIEVWGRVQPAVASLAELILNNGDWPGFDRERLATVAIQSIAPHGRGADAPSDEPLTQCELDILEALASSRHDAMLQVDVAVASGYKKSATREALARLRSLGFVVKPAGKQRKGDAITAKGRTYLEQRGRLIAAPAARKP